MRTYKILSAEAAERYQAEQGTTVELELTDDQEQAVIAAGWLEATPKKPKEAKT